jgi:hypothetical protein
MLSDHRRLKRSGTIKVYVSAETKELEGRGMNTQFPSQGRVHFLAL